MNPSDTMTPRERLLALILADELQMLWPLPTCCVRHHAIATALTMGLRDYSQDGRN